MGMKKLPVVFAAGNGNLENQPSLFVQNLLLKALSSGVTDPEELRNIAGLKKITDVYVALDKLALRKEYHSALARAGVDLDYLVKKLKEAMDHPSADVSLKAVSLLIKSIGLDKYESDEGSEAKSWEEIVLQRNEIGETIDAKIVKEEDYEVEPVHIPEDIAKKHDAIREEHKQLYE